MRRSLKCGSSRAESGDARPIRPPLPVESEVGRLAQLARALPLQGRGRRFEPVNAHGRAGSTVSTGAGAGVEPTPSGRFCPRPRIASVT